MSANKFLKICSISMIVILLLWIVILACMGEYATIPKMIGCFVAGWYLHKIVAKLENVRKHLADNHGTKSISENS